jgi:hypothetical protein
MFNPGDRFHRMTSRSASLYGSGLIRSASTTLKMATLAPMPIARERIAVSAKPGAWRMMRSA